MVKPRFEKVSCTLHWRFLHLVFKVFSPVLYSTYVFFTGTQRVQSSHDFIIHHKLKIKRCYFVFVFFKAVSHEAELYLSPRKLCVRLSNFSMNSLTFFPRCLVCNLITPFLISNLAATQVKKGQLQQKSSAVGSFSRYPASPGGTAGLPLLCLVWAWLFFGRS